MEFGPHARTRTPRQQAPGFAAVAESHHEQSRAAILATLRVAHHRTTAVVDLRLFSWGGENDAGRFWKPGPSKLANEALYRSGSFLLSPDRRPGPARWPCHCALAPVPARSAHGRVHR